MQRSGHRLALLACHLFKDFHLTQHGTRLIHQQHSRLGEQHFTAGPLQQHHAQLIFQLTNLPAKRRLANVAGICRTPKMAVFGQCHQVLKITNIHYPSSIATIVRGDR